MADNTELSIEVAGGVATIVLDRPPVNALTMGLYVRISELFQTVADRNDVNCVVLRAAGTKAFCAGFDFKLFAANAAEDDPARPLALRKMLETVRSCPIPVIAEVGGPALGAGCVLAAACDVLVASQYATFSIPEINFGRVGGAAHVGRHVPQGNVRLMAFTGQAIDAREAFRIGLVHVLVPADSLVAEVRTLAATIASKSAPALRHMKRALNQIELMPVDAGYEIEQQHSMIVRSLTLSNASPAKLDGRQS